MKIKVIIGCLATVLAAAGLSASSIAYSGGVWTENFNSIPVVDSDSRVTLTGTDVVGNQVDLPGLPGWQGARLGGSGSGNIALWEDSPGAGGRFYAWGAGSNRSLGSLASGTNIQGFGAAFENTSGQAFTEVTVTYTRQIWHQQGTSTQNLYENRLLFAYGLSADGIAADNFITNNGMTLYPALDAVSVEENTVTGTSANTDPDRRVDGSLPEWSEEVSATITGLEWGPGETLFIRWNDFDQAGFDAGLAVNDFSMVAIPEPGAAAAALGLLAAALVWRNRRTVK
ncbi:MAG: hypothetical protein JJU00_13240 [Opitutales bacterium]|nr:hypothetical protein [Opitutales bacterium]